MKRRILKKEIINLYPGRDCLFCGEENPIGLKLKFYLDEETGEVSTEYLPSRLFVGLGNVLHGGIQAGLFDEIMGWTAHNLTGEMGVTSELRVKFLKPVYLGKQIMGLLPPDFSGWRQGLPGCEDRDP